MTISSFCKKTGWPYEEFMTLYWSEANEIMALFDLRLAFTFPKKPLSAKAKKRAVRELESLLRER